MSEFGQAVATLWASAEASLREGIREKHWAADERFLTDLLRGELRSQFLRRTTSESLADALRSDLARDHGVSYDQATTALSGLTACVNFHPPTVEGVTGGDFGVVLVRPKFERAGDHVACRCERWGLLVQAKMRNRDGRWGRFSDPQLGILPERKPYLAVLRYSYADAARRDLQPFEWIDCSTIEEADPLRWRIGSRPSANTDWIMGRLSDGLIGTNSAETIRDAIAPAAMNGMLEVVIWFSDSPPDPIHLVAQRQIVRQGE